MKRLFSLSESDSEYLNIEQDKIELVSCPRKEMICKEHLSVVNECYVISEQHRRDKNFQLSIEILKNAFYKTTELSEPPCSKCSVLFRSTITESVERIQDELEKMTTGIFGSKRYLSSLLLANNVLKELENVSLCNTVQLNRPKERSIENYLKKRVS
ncbi:MAG TPA: hypothetical protein VLQ91_05210 [Draconibacterium sp.]|nr:hypothetical protein [Draconibacterium sp.]